MESKRYRELMTVPEAQMTPEELTQGWHFCCEWDYMLVGPGMPEAELAYCSCTRGLDHRPKGEKMSRKAALEQGFLIDSNKYPNVAYKGPRFAPTEWHTVPTEREEELEDVLNELLVLLESRKRS